jgi:hypothetical protein
MSSMKAVDVTGITQGLDLDPTALQGMSPEVLAGAAAAIVLVTAAAALSSGGGSASEATTAGVAQPVQQEEPVEVIDVSIPYDAAIIQAYDAWRSGDYDQAEYGKFKAKYIVKTVAEVTAKKVARELQTMQ